MSTPDPDERLRQVVRDLVAREGCVWAGISFVEGSSLVLGPQAGAPRPESRTRVSVLWRGVRVAELAADGLVDRAELEATAARIADLCLVGWDTGGEAWDR
jgi:putative methionine-R-sulfoxide reductase with GAF domain